MTDGAGPGRRGLDLVGAHVVAVHESGVADPDIVGVARLRTFRTDVRDRHVLFLPLDASAKKPAPRPYGHLKMSPLVTPKRYRTCVIMLTIP
jgi:hypothetical protein